MRVTNSRAPVSAEVTPLGSVPSTASPGSISSHRRISIRVTAINADPLGRAPLQGSGSPCVVSVMVAPALHHSLILGRCAGFTLGTPSKRNTLVPFSQEESAPKSPPLIVFSYGTPHLLATDLPQSYVFTTAIFLFICLYFETRSR